MSWKRCWPLVALLLITWLIVARLTSVPPASTSTPDLETGVPTRFGDWQMVSMELSHVSALVAANGSPYDQQVVRTYRSLDGQVVMLTLAYGRTQTALTGIHDPTACYPGAGFDLLNVRPVRLQSIETDPAHPLMANQMLARRGSRVEAVSYWVRTGEQYGLSSRARRWYLTQQRLQGHVRDGMLVRASSLVFDPAEAPATHRLLERFLAELLINSPPDIRRLLRS